MRKKFVLNEHMDIVLDDDGKTHVYIDGKQFIQCMRLVLTIQLENSLASIDSIDDAADKFGTIYEGKGVEPPVGNISIDPETEFHGHCSNLQAWVENGYDTRLLHSSISFPLLKELAKLGDEKAKRVLQADIEERLQNGTDSTRLTIIAICGEFLGINRVESIIENFDNKKKSDAWFNLGLSLLKSGDLSNSIDASRRAITIDPGHASAWHNLGVGLEKSGDLKGAKKAYQRADAIRRDLYFDSLGMNPFVPFD